MGSFELHQPTKLEEVLDLLQEERDYQLLAGGTDLIAKWKRGQLALDNVIDIKRIDELNFLEFTREGLKIGASTKISEVVGNKLVQSKYPALEEAAQKHSSPLTRNMATVVGNICNGSPAADLIPPLLVYNAKLKIKSNEQEFSMELKNFFTGPGQTKLPNDALVTSIEVPPPKDELKSAFFKYGKREAHEIAVVNGAVSYLETEEKIKDLKLALGAVGPTPLFFEIDWFDQINKENLDKLTDLIKDEVSPITDQRSTAQHREDVIQVLVKRAIMAANSV